MLEREFNDFGDLGHRPVDRCHPGQRAHREPLAARMQPAQQRLGHHRIAYPLRGDDEGSAQRMSLRARPAIHGWFAKVDAGSSPA
jgi:hypothetical protein